MFPGEKGVYAGWSHSKERLDRRSGVSGWTLHDLRRTMATGFSWTITVIVRFCFLGLRGIY